MSHIIIPEGYQSLLGLYDTQKAIGLIKTIFQEKLCMALHLKRVTAPLFVMQGSGLNDDLNGVERPVSFDVPSLNEQAEVVHSLANSHIFSTSSAGRPIIAYIEPLLASAAFCIAAALALMSLKPSSIVTTPAATIAAYSPSE